jgi:hypothetical protein
MSQQHEFIMSDETVNEQEPAPVKAKLKAAKSNGHDKAPVKAAGKRKVKAAAKAPVKAKTAPKVKAKAAKAPDKAKAAKPKASKVDKDQFGFRKGSAKSEAAALYARKSGATLGEVKEKLGSVQLNVLVALEAEGRTVDKVKEARKGQRPATRYFLKP